MFHRFWIYSHFCFFPLLFSLSYLHPPSHLFPSLPLCNLFLVQVLHLFTCYQWPDIVLGASSSIGLQKDHQLTFLALLLPSPSLPPFSHRPFVPKCLFWFTVWPTFLCSASALTSSQGKANSTLITGCVLISWFRANPFHHFSTFFSYSYSFSVYYPLPVLSLSSPPPIPPIAQPSKKCTKSLLLSLCWSIENETTVPSPNQSVFSSFSLLKEIKQKEKKCIAGLGC